MLRDGDPGVLSGRAQRVLPLGMLRLAVTAQRLGSPYLRKARPPAIGVDGFAETVLELVFWLVPQLFPDFSRIDLADTHGIASRLNVNGGVGQDPLDALRCFS